MISIFPRLRAVNSDIKEKVCKDGKVPDKLWKEIIFIKGFLNKEVGGDEDTLSFPHREL